MPPLKPTMTRRRTDSRNGGCSLSRCLPGFLPLLAGLWRGIAALGEVRSDLVLQDFLDHDFQIGAAMALDQRAGPIDDEFLQPPLNERGELEPAAELLDNRIALEIFNHETTDSRCAWKWPDPHFRGPRSSRTE